MRQELNQTSEKVRERFDLDFLPWLSILHPRNLAYLRLSLYLSPHKVFPISRHDILGIIHFYDLAVRGKFDGLSSLWELAFCWLECLLLFGDLIP